MEQLDKAKSLLKQVWGFDSFRDGQEELIKSVLDRRNTLAILPTGSGKSLGYQLPALMMDGTCIVVTPLIALMQDQVQKLRKLKVSAAAIHSGLNAREIDLVLDNCIYGTIKLLYVSPERINSPLFMARAVKMNISLLAVDEAHCISQWGHDFRPSYQNISGIKELQKDLVTVALTATATKQVIIDIQKHLILDDCKLIKESFRRTNLSINVLKTDHKFKQLKSILKLNFGSGIIYVRHRKTAFELSQNLKGLIKSDYYHAGLSHTERMKKQAAWLSGDIDVIIATNAFGMGIDKSNVRFVIHYGLSPSIEEYYQEIGRAGRDQLLSNTYVIYSANDVNRLKVAHQKSYPPVGDIRKAYALLFNYFEIPVGQGEFLSKDFNINHFASYCGSNVAIVYRILKQLESSSFISISRGMKRKEAIKLLVDRGFIFELRGAFREICIYLLRNIENVQQATATFNTKKVANEMELDHADLIGHLNKMHKLNFIHFRGLTEKPFITFLQNRFASQNLRINESQYHKRQNNELEKNQNMISFLDTNDCKMDYIISYFGEELEFICGNCDSCLTKQFMKEITDDKLVETISLNLESALPIEDLIGKFEFYKQSRILNLINEMIDQNKLKYKDHLIHLN